MTPDHQPSDATSPAYGSAAAGVPPRPAPFRWWLLAIGLLAVLGAVGVRVWQSQQPEPPVSLAGSPERIDRKWAEREQTVQALVEGVRKGQPELDEATPHPVTRVPSNAEPDLSAFRIAQDDRTYDLRGWKVVNPGDGPHTAGVVMTRRLRLTKVAKADRVDFLARTSGSDLAMRCVSPSADKATVAVSETRPVVKDRESNREMVEHRLSADVSNVAVGAEFELTYRVTYWNSLQTPEEQWFGTIGYDGSNLLSVLILFPESRPFQGGGLRTGPARGELVPYDGTQMVFKGAGGSWMYWEVPGPKTGNIYRVDWRW